MALNPNPSYKPPIGEFGPELIVPLCNSKVTIPLERYDELIRAEAALKGLCKALEAENHYEMKYYRPFLGEYWPENKEAKNEPES